MDNNDTESERTWIRWKQPILGRRAWLLTCVIGAVLLLAPVAVSFGSELPPLHAAAASGEEEAVAALLSKGTPVDGKRKVGRTPLQLAAANGHVDVVALLLENGAQVNAKDNSDGWAALHLGAFAGHKEVVAQLIQAGGDVNARGHQGSTPVHLAVYKGHQAAAKLLLKHGAKVGCKDKRGRTPLHMAAMGRHAPLAKLLIQNGAEVGVRDKTGRTPLHVALRARAGKIARLLIKNGANLNAQDMGDETPLHVAAREGLGTVSVLLEKRGAKVKVRDKKGQTALHVAAAEGHKDLLSLLIKKGLDVTRPDKDGNTPLHLAARNGRKEAVAFLLEKMKNINLTNKHGRTPLHLAAEGEKKRLSFEPPFERHCGVVALLLAGGARIDAKDNDGRTPLHLAALKGHENVVAVLLENGAKSNAKGDDGHTAFDLARKGKRGDVTVVLKLRANELEAYVKRIRKEENIWREQLKGVHKNQGAGKRGQGTKDIKKLPDEERQQSELTIRKYVFCQLRHNGDNWDVNTKGFFRVYKRFQQVVAYERITKKAAVAIRELPHLVEDDSLALVYMTGEGKIEFSDKQVEFLREFLRRGGFLLADSAGGSFHRSFGALMKRVFADWDEGFKKLPKDHRLYRGPYMPYSLPDGCPVFQKHAGWKKTGYGYSIQGRLAVFYSGGELGAGWCAVKADESERGAPAEQSRKARLALRTGVNIAAYSPLYANRPE